MPGSTTPVEAPPTAGATLADGEASPERLAEVLAEVTPLIVAVLGEDYLVGIDIDLDTSFNDDLETESIEFVALAESLRERYGDSVDFVGWIAEMEVDDIMALTVGELVEFIASCR